MTRNLTRPKTVETMSRPRLMPSTVRNSVVAIVVSKLRTFMMKVMSLIPVNKGSRAQGVAREFPDDWITISPLLDWRVTSGAESRRLYPAMRDLSR